MHARIPTYMHYLLKSRCWDKFCRNPLFLWWWWRAIEGENPAKILSLWLLVGFRFGRVVLFCLSRCHDGLLVLEDWHCSEILRVISTTRTFPAFHWKYSKIASINALPPVIGLTTGGYLNNNGHPYRGLCVGVLPGFSRRSLSGGSLLPWPRRGIMQLKSRNSSHIGRLDDLVPIAWRGHKTFMSWKRLWLVFNP